MSPSPDLLGVLTDLGGKTYNRAMEWPTEKPTAVVVDRRSSSGEEKTL
jgi:hypothetical protein